MRFFVPIMVLLFSFGAWADRDACLGFPSEQSFECYRAETGKEYSVYIPAGDECNQPPYQGYIDDTFVVYYPRVIYKPNGSEMERHLIFYESPDADSEPTEWVCL